MSKRYKIYGLEWLMVAPHKFDLANNEAIDFSCNDNKPFVLYRDINDVLKQLSINSNYFVYWAYIPKELEAVISAIDDNGNDCLNQIDPNDIEESLGRISNRAIDNCSTSDKVDELVSMLTPKNEIEKILNLSQNRTSIKTCELKRVYLLSELQTTYYVVVGNNYNQGEEVEPQDLFENKFFDSLDSLRRSYINAIFYDWSVFKVYLGDILEYHIHRIKIPLLKYVGDVLSIITEAVSHLE